MTIASVARKKPPRDKSAKIVRGPEAAEPIDAYVLRKNIKLKPVADAQLLKKMVTGSREAINAWGAPTFEYHGPMCDMMVGKNHFTLGFTRGTSLEDSAELLEGTGNNLRHVKVKEVEQLRHANLRQLLREAAALNESAPLSVSMRARKS